MVLFLAQSVEEGSHVRIFQAQWPRQRSLESSRTRKTRANKRGWLIFGPPGRAVGWGMGGRGPTTCDPSPRTLAQSPPVLVQSGPTGDGQDTSRLLETLPRTPAKMPSPLGRTRSSGLTPAASRARRIAAACRGTWERFLLSPRLILPQPGSIATLAIAQCHIWRGETGAFAANDALHRVHVAGIPCVVREMGPLAGHPEGPATHACLPASAAIVRPPAPSDAETLCTWATCNPPRCPPVRT
ncbi:hypothetical protein BJY00DRAFT_296218 [Aspergillus carlsbadensis]|nr:hypothetical protein BJY00DRAFT_296218 [Aspergillus carlsbadensis]